MSTVVSAPRQCFPGRREHALAGGLTTARLLRDGAAARARRGRSGRREALAIAATRNSISSTATRRQ